MCIIPFSICVKLILGYYILKFYEVIRFKSVVLGFCKNEVYLVCFSLTIFTADSDPSPPKRKLIFDDPEYHKLLSV
jgi:hypothetical protein